MAREKPRTYSEDEIKARLERELPHWYLEDGWIRRHYRTNSWKGTLMVINAVGHLAEAAWHHPDITASYAWVEVRLMSHDAVGQVEDVSTLPAFRNRGYARAVVSAAVTASRDAGHALTFIIADEDDWPRRLYAKLGFAPVGTTSRFRKT